MRLAVKLACILILAIFAFQANACDYPVKLDAGDTVECDGFILTEPQFVIASNAKKNLRTLELKVEAYEGLEDLYEARHGELKKSLKTAKNTIRINEYKTNFGYVISFSVGALITGLIAKELAR